MSKALTIFKEFQAMVENSLGKKISNVLGVTMVVNLVLKLLETIAK
jgi:uncharacterized membrane protein